MCHGNVSHIDAFIGILSQSQRTWLLSVSLAKNHNDTLYHGKTMTSLRGLSEWTIAAGSRWQQQPQKQPSERQVHCNVRHSRGAMFLGGILVVWVLSEGFFSLFPIPILWGLCYIPLNFLFLEMGDSSHTVWTARPLLPFSLLSFSYPSHTQWPASHLSDLSTELGASVSDDLSMACNFISRYCIYMS